MYYNLIHFPFSSINENKYTLVLCLNSNADFEEINKMLRDDSELFKQKATQLVTGDTVYNWEGTLTGSVKVTDDEREDSWTPLVCSKLSFNMAVSDFPTWLMPFCTNNRAKVILYRNIGLVKNEMWRGYLVAQTLNMTVVRNLLSCPLVAVDEVAMAKYMNFKETLEYVTHDKWNSIFGLMSHFHTLHHTRGLSSVSPGFEKLYQIIGLSHANRLFWHRDMRVMDDDNNAVNNLPDTLVVNLDRWLWLDDEGKSETTWQDVLTEVLEYLGVTFAVGSYGLMTTCDAYILANPTDSALVQQFVEVFDSGTVTTHSTSMYATLSNPSKIGANLQISTEPDKYNKVKVTSVPERWKTHEYLTDKHYKDLDETKEIKYQWGTTDDDQNGPFINYGWHKMKYIGPDAKEAPFLNIPACQNGEGYLMARDGELPYDDLASCDTLDHPTAAVADSLDFITFKEGCCCVRIGGSAIGGIDEDNYLTNYFLIMNHMWGNMLGIGKEHEMQSAHMADTEWLRLMPMGDNKAIHPSNEHYLRIGMSLKFIRENMGRGTSNTGPGTFLYLPAPGVSYAMTQVNFSQPAILLPCEDSEYTKFENSTAHPNGHLDSWIQLKFSAYIHIGNFYYTNSQSWVYVNAGDTKPKCEVMMWNGSNEIEEADKYGYRPIVTKNFYYTISNPWRNNFVVSRNDDPAMLAPIDQQSIHGQPLHGKLEIQILGQINFMGNTAVMHNSIPFVLLNDIDITYTDEAELVGTEIDNKAEMTMDAVSHTKETYEKALAMATPKVDGFFNNVLVFDGGKAWHNLTAVKPQTANTDTTPEWMVATHLANQYSAAQLMVELETPVQYDTNVHNVCFKVQGLTETDGVFLPVKRTFDYTRETMRVKLQRVNVASSD